MRRSNTVLRVVSRQAEIKSGETVTWSDEIKDVPPVPPSRLGGGCKMIELKYLLTVRIFYSFSTFQCLLVKNEYVN